MKTIRKVSREQKALLVIEEALAERQVSRRTHRRSKLRDMEDWLFRIAHAGNSIYSCHSAHKAWTKELAQAAKAMGVK